MLYNGERSLSIQIGTLKLIRHKDKIYKNVKKNTLDGIKIRLDIEERKYSIRSHSNRNYLQWNKGKKNITKNDETLVIDESQAA